MEEEEVMTMPAEPESASCFLDDDGGSVVIAVEAADSAGHRQCLEVRVGPVFYDGQAAARPGVWVCYQHEHQASLPAGPVLLTPQVWRELAAAVEARLARWEEER